MKPKSDSAVALLPPLSGSAIPPMPEVSPRRPYEDHRPNGYLESDRDYFENNADACLWFLENADAIRHALNA
jgi:hypothetical protein